ncbi:MAG: Eco57I restriction-modification methylase domain-containing protein [Planctomycetes bacterium]|nr:Eco57I restriction-modification methylase domain-containing protein [Planctomycetota bacterium]
MNGGLFECLDAPDPKLKGRQGGEVIRYEDGFSDREDNKLDVPNYLFFGSEQTVDLSDIYGDKKRKKEKVRGIIHILGNYKFTIVENTPIEQEIALDPELLGKVFENLLASYNPETQTTARKQSGSFYTPREIVDYMVGESLIEYLKDALIPKEASHEQKNEIDDRLRQLFAYTDEDHKFSDSEVKAIISAIDNCKILDPACGSGAFPMGALHKLEFILGKLDKDNALWRDRQIKKVEDAISAGKDSAMEIDDSELRDQLDEDLSAKRKDILEAFAQNELGYGRKLYLIENCIYGVDIQSIATQISKLRFFISLIVDQKVDAKKENFGVRPLPNLETKFATANTLIPIEKPDSLGDIFDKKEVKLLEKELKQVRHNLFSAKTPATKRKYRDLDQKLREGIAAELETTGWGTDSARKLASWDPYDQNASADYFDPAWMFGVHGGFDVVIGNPPYVRQESIKELKSALKESGYECYTGTADLLVYFYERGVKLLRKNGVIALITSNKFYRAGYGEKLRDFLARELSIKRLIDFGDAPVFDAIAYASIFIGMRKAPGSDDSALAYTWERELPIERIAQIAQIVTERGLRIRQEELKPDGWRLESPAVLRLLEKLRNAGTPLGEYVGGRFYYGIKTGLNEAFVVDRATRDKLISEHPSSAEVLKPFLRGRDVKRWRVEFSGQYLIKIESSENKDHPWSGKSEKEAEKIFGKVYPAIHERFQSLRDIKLEKPDARGCRNKLEQLQRRDDQGRYFWELRSCAYWQEFEQTKIVYPDIYEHQSFTWNEETIYVANTCYFIPSTEKWLTALLNSRAVEWFYSNISNKVRGGYLRAFSDYIKQIPTPSSTLEQQKRIERLVDQILKAKKSDADADVSALEREIDEIVYGLYDLTPVEIEIVEGKSNEL